MKNKRNPFARLLSVVMLLSLCCLFTACPDSDEGDDISPNNHEYVDMGLPSGTKWATCNVGASTPEDYGDYYAWGETKPKELYQWDTYWYGFDEKNLISIGSDIAGTQYDAATANWGALWCMPSSDQIRELIDNTTSVLTKQNGVAGCKFTSKKNGNAIFLPAAGRRNSSSLDGQGKYGYYWSSTWHKDLRTGLTTSYARYLYFSSGYATTYGSGGNPYYGQSVRPVLRK